VNVKVIGAAKNIHLIDMLGREIMQSSTNQDGKAHFDISRLPRGIYSVLLDTYGRQFPVGKVAITSSR
jgi:hypothetical protein